jgi:branched-subunit amino acid aminotransferase/4-amino-4-deoxychorismate lyase
MPEPLVYLNGRTVPASQAALPIWDAGVVQGATVTEQTRTFRHRPWRLDDHLDRLFDSLRYAGIEPGLSKDQFATISSELVAHNAALIDPADDLGVLHFVTAGEYPTYAAAGRPARPGPTVCVHTFPLPFALWAKRMREGAHLITPSVRQLPPQCYDAKLKCRSRMHYYLADREARQVDPEASALLLDLDGHVTETSTANLLIVRRGALLSPTTRHTLAGISRQTVIELAAKRGIAFVERDLQLYDVLTADEAFLTSTPYCVMPVTRVNGVPVGGGRVGPMCRQLLAAWSEVVGLDIEAQIQERARRAGQ